MYMSRVQKFEDEKNVENWKGGADGILVFVRCQHQPWSHFHQLTFQTGLFSSTVATFIALSYPNLQQDPNVTTQLLLQQISQQLSNTTTGDHGGFSDVSISNSFVLPASVVFINSVWFLSLVLSLTCALMATLLQQWARRYLQIVQRKYAPLHYVRIHEYFSRGAHRFGIFGFVEVLPLLLLLSVLLFFAGLVVFAFRGNHVVAYFTLTIVGFFILSYIAFTLMPLVFHDCPYQTPLTSVLWFFGQIFTRSFFSVLYHCTKLFPNRRDAFSDSIAKSFRRRPRYETKSLSRNIISKLKTSTVYIPIDTTKRVLTRTLHWLNEDHELEEFVAGIPGLYESEAFSRVDTDDHGGDVQRKLRNIRTILAALPGPTNFHAPLSWSIVGLAQRAVTSDVSKFVQQRRIRTCLRALFHIPGAIRDVLAPLAAGKHYCHEILPLLNSPGSLEIIDELWDSPNDDVALSVRCAAAVVAAFIITPPRHLLENFVTPDDGRFIGDDDAGQEFLAERIRASADADGSVAPGNHPRSDSARLQNITRFLADITDKLRHMNTQWWTSDKANSICRERHVLYEARRTKEFHTGQGAFEQQGDRASDAFIRAAQQDLITITLEILARDPVGTAGRPQLKAFRDAYYRLGEVAVAQAWEQVCSQLHPESAVPSESSILEAWALAQAQAADVIDVVTRALEPVLMDLQVQIVEMPTIPTGDIPLLQMPFQLPVPPIVSSPPAATVITKDHSTPGPSHVGSSLRPQPPPPLILQTSIASSSAGLATAVGVSPV